MITSKLKWFTCLSIAVIFAGLVVPNAGSAAPRHPTSGIDWRAVINHLRAQAGLPGVTEDHVFSDGALKHSIYGVKTGEVAHGEDPASPYYTPEGDNASLQSILWGWPDPLTSEKAMISRFMTTPVHGKFLIEPQWVQMGYGFYAEDGEKRGSFTTIGAEWFTRAEPAADYFPIIWPGSGTVVPFTSGSDESPDYRGVCGFSASAQWGLPISFQFPPDEQMGVVGPSSLQRAGIELPHCLYKAEGAVFVISRVPLDPGSTYTATVTRNGQQFRTTFSTAPSLMTACSPSVPAGQAVSMRYVSLRDNNHAPGYYAAADYPYSKVEFAGGSIVEATVRPGPEPGSFDVIATHTFRQPGTFTFTSTVVDPFWIERTVSGSVTVTAAGSQPVPDEGCKAPSLPPHPQMPSPRPTLTPSDGFGPRPDYTSPPDEGQTPTAMPTDGGSSDYRREITLQLKRHLRVAGVVTSFPSLTACIAAQTITIEKLKAGDWTAIATTMSGSDGSFRKRLPDKPGRYRAAVEPYEATPDRSCLYGYSSAVRHRH